MSGLSHRHAELSEGFGARGGKPHFQGNLPSLLSLTSHTLAVPRGLPDAQDCLWFSASPRPGLLRRACSVKISLSELIQAGKT